MKPEHKAIADIVVQAMKPLKTEIAQLRERVSAMEAAPLKYLGEHEPGRMYGKNALVTNHAGAWVALRTTQQTPGSGDGWRHCNDDEVPA